MEHPLSETTSSENRYDDYETPSPRPAGIRFSSTFAHLNYIYTKINNPLSIASQSNTGPASTTIKKECLSIRVEDEVRIVTSLASAARKQATGSVFSVKVDISKTGTLGIGVSSRDLS